MKKWGTKIAVNFLVRGIVSFAIIFFVNGFLDGQGISACVGMNPVTFFDIGNPWISWGCHALRYNFLSNYVNIAQRLKIFKNTIDKYKLSGI